jgi:hypothetical protein
VNLPAVLARKVSVNTDALSTACFGESEKMEMITETLTVFCSLLLMHYFYDPNGCLLYSPINMCFCCLHLYQYVTRRARFICKTRLGVEK